MRYVISYDVPATTEGNKRRARLARRLERLALRVQGSVFEADLPPATIPRLLAELQDVFHPTEDSIRIYPLCAACTEKILHLGKEAPAEINDVIIF
jgi:CRISPR-associated protein Cas2